MQYLVTAEEMKRYDTNTIEAFGLEPLVLMERAALATVEEIIKRKPGRHRILVVAGSGNNGGDGLAIGRLMALAGHAVTFVYVGEEAKCSRETGHQMYILEKYGFPIQRKIETEEYDIIIDALLGIGFNRNMAGEYAAAVEKVNRLRAKGAFVVSVDIPSGVHAGDGRVTGRAVRADLTVTYGFAKRGHFFYPGAGHTGELTVRDIGITPHSFFGRPPELFTYSGSADLHLPVRVPEGHKGTFGKVLLIAGGRQTAGACILAGRGILWVGAGMLKVFTHESNRIPLQAALPEAMVSTWEDSSSPIPEAAQAAGSRAGVSDCGQMAESGEGAFDYGQVTERMAAAFGYSGLTGKTDSPFNFVQSIEQIKNPKDDILAPYIQEKLRENLAWADVIVIGPGLGTAPPAATLFHTILAESTLPVVADADAVNLLSKAPALRRLLSAQPAGRIILTPHVGEFARLAGCSAEIAGGPDFSPVKKTAAELNSIIVCKNARTVICAPDRSESYLNTSGNNGMATAGSGDVLAGMIGGLLAQGSDPFTAACTAVHLHGLAGDLAAAEKSEYSVTASDLAAALPEVLKKASEILKKAGAKQ